MLLAHVENVVTMYDEIIDNFHRYYIAKIIRDFGFTFKKIIHGSYTIISRQIVVRVII